MNQVVVVGVGMTRFGKQPERSLKELAREASRAALEDAGIPESAIEAAFVSNAMAGAIWRQESVRGQVFLSGTELAGIPMFNVENACASGSTAFHLACMSVLSGMYDTVLVLGVEKMIHPDKERTFRAFEGATDVESLLAFPGGGGRDRQSMFMDYYAEEARRHMELYGTPVEIFASIATKNSRHGALNPYAQYRVPQTVESVMASRVVSDPLRLLMCSPLSDGAAAAIVAREKTARRWTSRPVFVAGSVVLSALTGPASAGSEKKRSNVERAAERVYAQAGLGPRDLDVLEVHDAAAPGELWAYEQLGLCGPEEGAGLVESGDTALGGAVPVNPGGGLIARGHPVGATGLAQLAEIVWQLRGEAGERQVEGARTGLTQNAGGFLEGDSAAVSVHVLTR
ncbi:thiolase family protein [Kyrpidia tusciae]|uniref:propanoyl-CoA C-acyltransferase n=1 Tax=Kyrpidia tusciae (strain DSM 2912 / NBRC 15312 / T2) TaxID=562970 RepID=D5WQS4_KYRT2|nr:thiolase family protein [Kyrpidia tusciae]ADG06683.1 Beta-ketoacyl synthase [Kyrpidia tusciae DSM 2912]